MGNFDATILRQTNSRAVGMAVALPYGFQIDFVRNPISGSASWFFIIILKFIFTPILEIKIHTKKFFDTKNFHFRSPIFINSAFWPGNFAKMGHSGSNFDFHRTLANFISKLYPWPKIKNNRGQISLEGKNLSFWVKFQLW